MKAIVTGATGFIGTALCKELLENGYEVAVVVRPGSAKKEKLTPLLCPRLTIVEADLDRLGVLSDMAGKADAFFHLAWNGSSGDDRSDFAMQYRNIAYTGEALRAAKALGCRVFIGAGSQAEYGVVRGVAGEDVTVPHPFMMYGAAKLAAYQMGQVLAAQLNIRFVWPRIYSVYGVGENPGTLVSYVVDTLRQGGVPQLTPCENMWNFMYITDCVRALRLLSEHEDACGVYHVASADTRPLKDFVTQIRDILAPGSPLAFGAKSADSVRTFCLMPDVGKLTELGFACEVAFEDGIEKKLQVR